MRTYACIYACMYPVCIIYLGNILSYYRLKSRSEITIRHPDDGADDGADDDTLLLSSLVFFLGGERFLGARCS